MTGPSHLLIIIIIDDLLLIRNTVYTISLLFSTFTKEGSDKQTKHLLNKNIGINKS